MVLHPEEAFAADEGPQRCYYRSRSCWKVRRAAENVPLPCWCLFARAPSEATWPLCRHFDDVTHTHTHTSSVDDSWTEGLPHNGLTDVGGNEEG